MKNPINMGVARGNIIRYIESHVTNINPETLKYANLESRREKNSGNLDLDTAKCIIRMSNKYSDIRYQIADDAIVKYSDICLNSNISQTISSLNFFYEISEIDASENAILSKYLPYVNYILSAIHHDNTIIIDAIKLHDSMYRKCNLIRTSSCSDKSSIKSYIRISTTDSDNIDNSSDNKFAVSKCLNDIELAAAILEIAIKISHMANIINPNENIKDIVNISKGNFITMFDDENMLLTMMEAVDRIADHIVCDKHCQTK